MNIITGNIPDNYNKMRDRISLPKVQFSRESSMSSTKSSVAYYEKIELNNAINKDVDMVNDFLALSYEISQKKAIQVSMAADSNTNTLNKYIIIEYSISNIQHTSVKYSNSVSPHGNDTVINIQLPYNPNTPIEPNL